MRKKSSFAEPAVKVLLTLPGVAETPLEAGLPATVILQVSGLAVDNFFGANLSKEMSLQGLNLPTREIVEAAIAVGVADLIIGGNEISATSYFDMTPFQEQIETILRRHAVNAA